MAELAAPFPLTVIAELLGIDEADREDFRALVRCGDRVARPASRRDDGRARRALGVHRGAHRGQAGAAGGGSRVAAGAGRGRRVPAQQGGALHVPPDAARGRERDHAHAPVGDGARPRTSTPTSGPRWPPIPRCSPAAWRSACAGSRPCTPSAGPPPRTPWSAGRAIGEGDYLCMLYASGNRDERVFGDDAARFDVRRPTNPMHLAFGFGEHVCLGASLARLEAPDLPGGAAGAVPRLRGDGLGRSGCSRRRWRASGRCRWCWRPRPEGRPGEARRAAPRPRRRRRSAAASRPSAPIGPARPRAAP